MPPAIMHMQLLSAAVFVVLMLIADFVWHSYLGLSNCGEAGASAILSNFSMLMRQCVAPTLPIDTIGCSDAGGDLFR